jgi:hypothetical protein
LLRSIQHITSVTDDNPELHFLKRGKIKALVNRVIIDKRRGLKVEIKLETSEQATHGYLFDQRGRNLRPFGRPEEDPRVYDSMRSGEVREIAQRLV